MNAFVLIAIVLFLGIGLVGLLGDIHEVGNVPPPAKKEEARAPDEEEK